MDLVASQQRQAASQTLQVRQALNTLREQSQWLGSSTCSAKRCGRRWHGYRKCQNHNSLIPKWRSYVCNGYVMRICLINSRCYGKSISRRQPLTAEQNRILEAQLRTQRELLNSLLQGGDTLLLELTKLKVSNGQLEDALKEVNEATHRYLFWTSDVRPMTIAWPLEIAQDLRRLISLDTFSQLGKASVMMLTSKRRFCRCLAR